MSPKRRWWLLAVALLVLLLVNLGTRGLNEPDEGRYADIAGEMLESEHGWWEPSMSDLAHYDKPPMIYWFTAVAFKLFGSSEWAARLPCFLGAVMALVGVGWVATRLYGSRTAWWAVLFCGTLGQFWVLARMLTPDMLLTGFVTLAIGFWSEARHRNGKGFWWWGCVLFWSLAWWTKATAALVPMLGLTLGLLATRDKLGLRALRPFWLLLLVLLVGSPWYIGMMHRHPELEHFFFGRELAGRIVGHPDGRREPIYFHLLFTLAGWFPWWPATLIVFFRNWKGMLLRFQTQRWGALPVEAWMVLTGLIVFSLLSSKLITYTLPFAPWAALLCARMLVARDFDAARPTSKRPALAVAGACSVLFIIATFVLPRWESRLGLGSSLREVSHELKKQNATIVCIDRYMSGLEFYFGESVIYVTDHIPRELSTDVGICDTINEPHFVKPGDVQALLQRHSADAVWFIRYKGRANSSLADALQKVPSLATVRVGDFVLDHVQASALTNQVVTH